MIRIITHNGAFHADDTFALATLQLHLGVNNVEIVRTRDESIIAAGDWVVDVGGMYDPHTKRFDHHQPGAPVRDNGLPYAAFGLIWKEIGESVSRSKEVAKRIEERLVLPIDANDVGVSIHNALDFELIPFEIHDVITVFNPPRNSDEDADKNFAQALTVARMVLERLIIRTHARIHSEMHALDLYKNAADKKVLVSDIAMSSDLFIDYKDVEVLVAPDNPKTSSNWFAAIIPKASGSFETDSKFPSAWAGLRTSELAEVSGIEDAFFCHKNLHFFVAGSREGALQASKLVVRG